jgi:hypothetical protein
MRTTLKIPNYSYITTCFWVIYPPQIPSGLVLDITRASALRDGRLRSTVMERLATSEPGHFSDSDVEIAKDCGWTVRNSKLSVSARGFLFATAIRTTQGPAQPPVLPVSGVKWSGCNIYYSPCLGPKVWTVQL